jgi:hypothetical protein
MADKEAPTIKELTARLRATIAQRAREQEARPDDPRRRDAIAGLIACLDAPRRIEGKQEIGRILAGALAVSVGRAPAERVLLLKRSFEAYADELRQAGEEHTAKIADRASGHCSEWIKAIHDAGSSADDASGPGYALVFPGQLEATGG